VGESGIDSATDGNADILYTESLELQSSLRRTASKWRWNWLKAYMLP